ncbi:MAG: mechanosensitive ion channel [Candidatus Margulisbacteria bacterium]|nr:mechanosensitive ion channel [Candidatus Margulisiibacteriota bacterium]
MLLKIIQIIRNVVLSRHNIEIKDNIHVRTLHTQIQLLTNIISIIIIILTIALILLSFPEAKQVGITILASAGIIGVILGLTAQKTLGNLIAGIQIAISQPIRIDDVVVVENEWGRIEEITLTYVVVRIWDLRRLIVPIAYFVEKPFQNWTHRSDQLMGTVFFYVDYSLPVNELRNELTAILNKSKFWDKRVNDLSVTNLTEKTVELRAVVSAADSSTLWNLRCEVREKLWLFLQKNFIDNFPRVRIEMKPDNVNTQGSKLTSV